MNIGRMFIILSFACLPALNVQAEQEIRDNEFPNLNIVVTAEDHFDLAAVYRKQAAYYRRQAEDHRGMKKVYRRSEESSEGSVRESWEMMDEHCDAIISQLSGLAVMMDQQAEWHEERGSWQ